MTTTLIDARSSQNASYANSIAVSLSANTPDLVGQIGLNVPSDTPGNIRSQLEGTVTISIPIAETTATITVTIVRGTLPTDELIYSASEIMGILTGGPTVLTVAASDYNAPAPQDGELVYTMFVSSDTSGVFRVGPEDFNGAVYTS